MQKLKPPFLIVANWKMPLQKVLQALSMSLGIALCSHALAAQATLQDPIKMIIHANNIDPENKVGKIQLIRLNKAEIDIWTTAQDIFNTEIEVQGTGNFSIKIQASKSLRLVDSEESLWLDGYRSCDSDYLPLTEVRHNVFLVPSHKELKQSCTLEEGSVKGVADYLTAEIENEIKTAEGSGFWLKQWLANVKRAKSLQQYPFEEELRMIRVRLLDQSTAEPKVLKEVTVSIFTGC